MTNTSNQCFWLLTVGLVLLWTIVLATAAENRTLPPARPTTSLAAAAKETTESKDARNCKALCGHCGCMGFYCGEECICECNDDDDDKSDTECIATMQENARKLRIPFELLIQGPTANRFVRNALQFEQNADRKAVAPIGRNKRSTVVIYKPAVANSLCAAPEPSKYADAEKAGRQKRSVSPHLEWFSDFANTLVRPAPLGGARRVEKAVEAVEEPPIQHKRSTDEIDRSWFSDNANMLIRPSPLFKRHNGRAGEQDRAEQNAENYDESFQPGRRIVEKFPQAIKDTIRNLQEGGINDEFTDAVRMKFKQGTEVLQSTLDKNLNFMDNGREQASKSFEEAFRNMNLFQKNNEPKPEPPSLPLSPPIKYVLPWFKPVRFLQRVQHAIN